MREWNAALQHRTLCFWMCAQARNTKKAISLAAETSQWMRCRLSMDCLSGARSSHAAAVLRRMGYCNVTNIGGINRYRGKVEC